MNPVAKWWAPKLNGNGLKFRRVTHKFRRNRAWGMFSILNSRISLRIRENIVNIKTPRNIYVHIHDMDCYWEFCAHEKFKFGTRECWNEHSLWISEDFGMSSVILFPFFLCMIKCDNCKCFLLWFIMFYVLFM